VPDILPPQLVGVQQRPLYVKVRTALTVISSIWLLMAITGFGFFSGGTTSLALSLVLLYGTGTALIVVMAAVYRLVKNSAVKRTETAPDDTAAVVFVDTARSASEELLAALRPAAATGRPSAVSPRTVRAAVPPEATTPAVTTPAAAAAAPSAAKASGSKASGSKAPAAKASKAKPADAKPQAQKQPAKATKSSSVTGTPAASAKTSAVAKGTAKTGTTSAAAQRVSPSQQKTGAAKSAPKSALNKAVPNKNTAGKPGPGKTAPVKSGPGKASVKSAQRTKASSKAPQGRTTQAKGRPANNSESVSAAAKRTAGSADRQTGVKQPGAKDSSAGPVGAVVQICNTAQKSTRPALVLASSNAMPQPRLQHVPDSRKRAS
jgi:hypothetical protein